MTPPIMNHVMYNTGRWERIAIKNLRLPPHEKIGLDWVIRQAQSPEGVDIDDNIILKVYPGTYRYTATFAYGTYVSNQVFLISCGVSTKGEMDRFWDHLIGTVGPKYQVSTPLEHRPGGPLLIDIVLPNSPPEAVSYLYSSNCYDLCLKLGWTLLYPDTLRI